MKEGNIPGLPSALLKMMEPPIPIDGDEELYDNLLRELAADLQPKKMVDWIRVIRFAVRVAFGAPATLPQAVS